MVRTLVLTLILSALPRMAQGAGKRDGSASARSSAQAALESAKRDWQALKHDPKRSRYRSHWLEVAGKFAQVARRHPHSPEAAKALFDAAELYEDLSRISWIQDDVDQAVAHYQRLARSFPHDTLADDALLAVARIELSRKNDPDAARSALSALLKGHPRGDMAASAKAMLAQLPKEELAARLPAAPPKHLRVAPARNCQPEEGVKLSDRDPPKVKVTEVAWADAHPAPAASKPASDSGGAPAEGSAQRAADEQTGPLLPVALPHGADKGKLAAMEGAVKSDDDLPLSAQMGLKVRRVVIDAGHGGHDTGAVGPGGAKEKDVTLAVAEKLAAKLRAEGLEVFMTRTSDRFVSLEDRAAFANAQRADLFISVHCNASTAHSLHGVETYSLNVSANRYAMRLAARENASSERSISDLQYMLADIATRADTEDSRELAQLVQRSVVQGLRTRYGRVRDLGTKEALFYVLLGTRMPAILVEGSFISNPEEERRLTDASFQDQLAGSIAAGVEHFVDDRHALATAGLP